LLTPTKATANATLSNLMSFERVSGAGSDVAVSEK